MKRKAKNTPTAAMRLRALGAYYGWYGALDGPMVHGWVIRDCGIGRYLGPTATEALRELYNPSTGS